jgi:three-Cys-motif partner protein
VATGELVVGSDGELVLKIGLWALGKLSYIRRYCDVFNTGMKAKWSKRSYIDLFAGAGKCLVETTMKEVDGSPLVALSSKVPFTHYFFNDMNASAIESLRKRTARTGVESIVYFGKDCNAVINDLLSCLPLGSLDFCFIDPTNWQISFNSIRKLTQGRRMDLAVTFHVGAIKRVADHPPQELLDFFPDSSWLEDYQKARKAGTMVGRALLDSYERGLGELGYVEIKDYILAKNTKHVPLYYLVFASRNRRGGDFWDKVAMRSETGQLRLHI